MFRIDYIYRYSNRIIVWKTYVKPILWSNTSMKYELSCHNDVLGVLDLWYVNLKYFSRK